MLTYLILDYSFTVFLNISSCSCLQALPLLSVLEVINFDDCLVRTAGAKALAKALANNNHQLKVCVSFNLELLKVE